MTIASSMATSSRGPVVTTTMTLPRSSIELGTREALRQVFGAPRTPKEYQCCFGTPWPPKFGRFNIWDLAAGKTASKLWDATLKDLTLDLLNNIMTVGDTDAAVHAWMVGKNADRARPTIVVCSTAVDFRVEARRLLKGRVAKYNFGVMTVGTRLSRESGPSIFLDRKRSNVLPSLAYGIPICVNLGGRSATIGGEIRLDSERYGVTVAHVFDEGDWDTSPDEDIIDLEFDEYSDDDWNDSEASFDEHHHGSPTHNKDVRFTEDSKLESELKEAYYVLSKHPTFIRKSTSQLIGRLEDPPKLHRPHDWALIKLDAPDGIDNGPSTSSLGTGVSSVPFGSASYMRSNVVRLGSDFIEAEAFAAGVVAATFVQDRSSPTLDGNEEFHNWPAKLSDDPIAVKAFATGVVAATECLLVSQTEQSLSSNNEDNAYVQPAMQNSALPHSDTTLRAPSQASHSLQGDDVAENLGQEDSMRSDDMRTQDVHDRFFRNPASIHPLAHIPPLEPSLADLHTRAQPMVALRYLPKIKDVRKSIQPGLKTEDIEDNHVLPTEAETRRAIAIPCRYTRMMLDETVWIATGRGALLKGRGVPSTCILNMHSQGFVEAFVVSLVDDAIPGDCGSWVVNQSTDELIGMLIATSRPFGLAYLVPAFQIMADLKTMFPERTAYLPQEEDLRKLETQYSLYEQVAKEDKLHRYQDYTEHIETEQEGRSFPQHLAHELRSGKGKGKVEVYIVRCDRGTRNDSVHFTAESANRRMGDLVRKGDKSAMVTALTLAHGKVDSPEDRILAVLKLASLYRQQGRLEAAERIERQGRILQTHDPHFKSITTARSAVTTFLSSATAQSRRSSHTGSIPGSGPSSATTQTIENQHSSASRVALQAGNGKKGNIKPVVFDPEATRQQPSMSTKKEDHQIGDGKRANAAPDVPGREAIKHHMSAGRERTRVQAPALGFSNVYDWLLKLVWAIEIDVVMIGLQDAGKTTLLRVLAGGEFTLDSIPTVGFNMKRIQKGHVTLKCWDLGGQPRFRSMWERYCRGVNSIVFVVDAADPDAMPAAKEEIHTLMGKPSVAGIPLLVLGNKVDLEEHVSVDELIEILELKSISKREVSCYGISAKEETNLDTVLQWLIARTSKVK